MHRLTGSSLPVVSLLLLSVACSSPDEPPAGGVTLLVANLGCGISHCTPMRVLGFPSNQPLTPGGPWRIEMGVVTGHAACLRIPETADFTVIGGNNSGGLDTTVTGWTQAMPLILGWEPASQPPHFGSWPSSREFVPAQASGWQVSLTDAAPVSRGEACQP